MTTKLTIKKENTINDITTWLKYAEPEGGMSQWVEGRSAMEFARYMTSSNGSLPLELDAYLKSIGIKCGNFVCYPEEVTSFTGYNLGSGSGRHHDGLLVCNEIVVGVEAKVSEPFDNSISYKMEHAKKNHDKGENMRIRLYNSLKILKPSFDDQTLESVPSLMYQLISGTVGTIIEARNRNVRKAAFIVIEFVGDVKQEKNYDDKVKENQKAFEDFIKFIGLTEKKDEECFIDVYEDSLRVWIKKLKIKVQKNEYSYKVD